MLCGIICGWIRWTWPHVVSCCSCSLSPGNDDSATTHDTPHSKGYPRYCFAVEHKEKTSMAAVTTSAAENDCIYPLREGKALYVPVHMPGLFIKCSRQRTYQCYPWYVCTIWRSNSCNFAYSSIHRPETAEGDGVTCAWLNMCMCSCLLSPTAQALFKDFDKSNHGTVTEAQFFSLLNQAR